MFFTDPDPAFKMTTDPDQDSAFKMNMDPDPRVNFYQKKKRKKIR